MCLCRGRSASAPARVPCFAVIDHFFAGTQKRFGRFGFLPCTSVHSRCYARRLPGSFMLAFLPSSFSRTSMSLPRRALVLLACQHSCLHSASWSLTCVFLFPTHPLLALLCCHCTAPLDSLVFVGTWVGLPCAALPLCWCSYAWSSHASCVVVCHWCGTPLWCSHAWSSHARCVSMCRRQVKSHCIPTILPGACELVWVSERFC